MALSTLAKVAIAGTTAVTGVSVSCWAAQDYFNFFEVEREVMEEEVQFSVSPVETNSFNIEVKTGTGWGMDDDKYYWKCLIKNLTDSSAEEDLKIILNKATGNTYGIRRGLVRACSRKRVSLNNKDPSNKKVAAEIDLAAETTSEGSWYKKLFGEEILTPVEKEILNDDNKVYFEIRKEANKDTAIIKAKSDDNNSKFKTNGEYSWECFIHRLHGIDESKIKEKLPDESAISDIDTNGKKKARKQIVYACAKDSTKTITKKSVSAQVFLPINTGANNWSANLLGE